jgi:hypothetical protein
MRRRFIGNDMTRSSARQAVEATGVHIVPPPRATHRGNLAGLRDEKSVYLQHNQGGYANPAIQRARYNLKQMNTPTASPLRIPMGKRADRILDQRAIRQGSGAYSRLMRLIK